MSYRCPGCGKQHVTERPFEQAQQVTCLRCGGKIEVPATALEPATVGTAPSPEEAITAEPPEAPAPPRPRSRKVRPREAPAAPRNVPEETPYESPDLTQPPWWKRRAVLVGVGAVLLVGVLAGGYYFVFGFRTTARKPTERAKPIAKTAPTPPPATTPAPPPTTAKAAPPPPAPLKEPGRLSAPQLSAALAADAPGTNTRYEGAFLEISGLFDKFEPRDEGHPPVRPHAVFAVAGPSVSCDLQNSPTDAKLWNALKHGQPLTVRGTYAVDGFLHNCELLPFIATADGKYKGREVELTGYVDAVLVPTAEHPYPGLRLEGDTNSPVDVVCWFRKNDEEAVKKVEPGLLVTIKGTCNGRSHDQDTYHIRLDNCEMVYTSAPTGPVPRVSAVDFLRTYSDDLRTTVLPPAGTEERLEGVMAVSKLARELTDNDKAFAGYRGKFLTVTGPVQKKTPPAASVPGLVILETGDTDKAFTVQCYFSRRNFGDVDTATELRIDGLCTGMPDGQTLRLDDCEVLDPTGKRGSPRITADYLPHRPGQSLTYDVAMYPLSGTGRAAEPSEVRVICYMRADGVTETLTTLRGVPVGKSLFDPGAEKWLTSSRTKKVRDPGPILIRRVTGPLVEVGERRLNKEGKPDMVWEPVLKIGARVGDSWHWTNGNTHHDYSVVKFDEYEGRLAVVIKESAVTDIDIDHPHEVRYVYVEGVGQVERREWLLLARNEKKLFAEKKLIEDLTPPSKETGEKKPPAAAPEPEKGAPVKEGEDRKTPVGPEPEKGSSGKDLETASGTQSK